VDVFHIGLNIIETNLFVDFLFLKQKLFFSINFIDVDLNLLHFFYFDI